MVRTFHAVRVLVYVGPEEWIRKTFEKHYVKGRVDFPNGASISELIVSQPTEIVSGEVGETPENTGIDQLAMQTAEGFPATGTKCVECSEPQFETPSGVTCQNGHGGADGIGPDQEP